MVISHLHKFVYLGAPKTASRSMHVWLGQESLLGRDGCNTYLLPGLTHYQLIPEEFSEYLVFATTRNEPERLRSLWRHLMWCVSIGNDPMKGKLVRREDFDDWRSRRAPHLWMGQEMWTAKAMVLLDVSILDNAIKQLPFYGEAKTSLRRVGPPTLPASMTDDEIVSHVRSARLASHGDYQDYWSPEIDTAVVRHRRIGYQRRRREVEAFIEEKRRA